MFDSQHPNRFQICNCRMMNCNTNASREIGPVCLTRTWVETNVMGNRADIVMVAEQRQKDVVNYEAGDSLNGP